MYRCYVSVFLSHITFTNITSVSQIDVNVEGTTGSLQKVEIVPLLKWIKCKFWICKPAKIGILSIFQVFSSTS